MYTDISSEDYREQFASDDHQFVDVREEEEHAEVHIPGTINIAERIPGAASTKFNEDAPVILVCNMASLRHRQLLFLSALVTTRTSSTILKKHQGLAEKRLRDRRRIGGVAPIGASARQQFIDFIFTKEIAPMVLRSLVGASVKRKEDPSLITGAGKFVGDIKLPGMGHVAFLRSPYPRQNLGHRNRSCLGARRRLGRGHRRRPARSIRTGAGRRRRSRAGTLQSSRHIGRPRSARRRSRRGSHRDHGRNRRRRARRYCG